jgi:hypothetical protein
MIIFWLAVLGATIVVGLLTALVYATARGKRPTPRSVGLWALRLWLLNFVVDLAILYFAMPALTGPYWGGQWLLWPLLLTGTLALFGGSLANIRSALDSFTDSVNSGGGGTTFSLGRGPFGGGRRPTRVVEEREPRGGTPPTGTIAGGIAIAAVFIIAIVVNGLISVATTWFDPNAKALAAIPTIITEPSSTALPPTDVNHIVLVSRGVAAYLGQQVLAQSGQNLGSVYHTDRTEYTLQSVKVNGKGHLYWIAPLVYNNVWANLGNWESPGFIAVDAEDPNATPQLHTGLHMRYLPDAIFNQEIVRHVYLSGYTDGDLVDPTLEVDDSWRPYFTISLMRPSRGFTGEMVDRVLLVDAQTGGIQNFAPKDVPSWVDRVIPSDTVVNYLTWWGNYSNAPWFNPSGKNQQVPAVDSNNAPELVYNSVDSPVWLVPMTSSAQSDQSSTGVVLFDTRDNIGRFYPLAGLGVAANVTNTFKSNPKNIKNYDVSNVQLYSIYGEPTWVCTFTTAADSGDIFQAVGMVDARHLSGANVIQAGTKTDALAQYAQYLANQGVTTTPVPSGQKMTVQGTIASISSAVQSGSTVYYFQLAGQTRIFTANITLSPQLPLARPGDAISVTFFDTGQNVVTLTAFSDLDPRFGASPGASPGATPGATATPSATP